MQTIDEALNKLKKSDFRSRFHLKQKDIDYINEKGMNKTAPCRRFCQNTACTKIYSE